MEENSELHTLRTLAATLSELVTIDAVEAFDFVESFDETDSVGKVEPSRQTNPVDSDLESITPNCAAVSLPVRQEDGVETEEKKLAEFSRKRSCGEMKSPGTDSAAKRIRDKSKTLHQVEMEFLDLQYKLLKERQDKYMQLMEIMNTRIMEIVNTRITEKRRQLVDLNQLKTTLLDNKMTDVV